MAPGSYPGTGKHFIYCFCDFIFNVEKTSTPVGLHSFYITQPILFGIFIRVNEMVFRGNLCSAGIKQAFSKLFIVIVIVMYCSQITL